MYHKRIKLKKLRNARDLGGMPTMDGRRIRQRKLIRCAKLSNLPLSTRMSLKKMGVTTVVDLRMPAECNNRPDTRLEDSNYVQSPLVCSPTPGITAETTVFRSVRKEGKTIREQYATMDEYMQEMYLNILMDTRAKEEIKKFLHLVEIEEGCILWHCTSGKDRAGICAMLVESLLGVDKETILDDYLLSRKFCRRNFFFNRMGLIVLPGFKGVKKVLRAFMQIKREYLEGVMDELTRRYGSVVEYCKQELGVTDEMIATMKEKYLEPIPESEKVEAEEADETAATVAEKTTEAETVEAEEVKAETETVESEEVKAEVVKAEAEVVRPETAKAETKTVEADETAATVAEKTTEAEKTDDGAKE